MALQHEVGAADFQTHQPIRHVRQGLQHNPHRARARRQRVQRRNAPVVDHRVRRVARRQGLGALVGVEQRQRLGKARRVQPVHPVGRTHPENPQRGWSRLPCLCAGTDVQRVLDAHVFMAQAPHQPVGQGHRRGAGVEAGVGAALYLAQCLRQRPRQATTGGRGLRQRARGLAGHQARPSQPQGHAAAGKAQQACPVKRQ